MTDIAAKERMESICEAVSAWLANEDGVCRSSVEQTVNEGWFQRHDVEHMIDQVGKTVTPRALANWWERESASDRQVGQDEATKTDTEAEGAAEQHNRPGKVLCLHAGNLPMVGLQDVIATLLSGAVYYGKLSRKDPWLLDGLLRMLQKRMPGQVAQWSVQMEELQGIRAGKVLFAGSQASVEKVKRRIDELDLAAENARFLSRTARLSIAWLTKADFDEMAGKETSESDAKTAPEKEKNPDYGTTHGAMKSGRTTHGAIKSGNTAKSAMKSAHTAHGSMKSGNTAKSAMKSAHTAHGSMKSGRTTYGAGKSGHDDDNGTKRNIYRDLAEAMLRYDGKGCRSVAVVIAPRELSRCVCPLMNAARNFLRTHPATHTGKPGVRYWKNYLKTMGKEVYDFGGQIITSDTDLMGKEDVICWVKTAHEKEDSQADILGKGEIKEVERLAGQIGPQLQSVYVTDRHFSKIREHATKNRIKSPGNQKKVTENREAYRVNRSSAPEKLRSGSEEVTLSANMRLEPLSRAQAPPIDWRPDGIDVLRRLLPKLSDF